jgi:hypothetical protein
MCRPGFTSSDMTWMMPNADEVLMGEDPTLDIDEVDKDMCMELDREANTHDGGNGDEGNDKDDDSTEHWSSVCGHTYSR